MISGCTAYDLIVVLGSGHTDVRNKTSHIDDDKYYNKNAALVDISSSECIFRFGAHCSSSDHRAHGATHPYRSVDLVVHNRSTGGTLRFPISLYNAIQQQRQDSTSPPDDSQQRQHNPDALRRLVDAIATASTPDSYTGSATNGNISCGPYKANFILFSNIDKDDTSAASEETVLGIAPMNIYIYPYNDTQLAIVDVDGTITTSTLSGFWNTAILHDYSAARHCHAGVCQFFSKLVVVNNNNGSPTTIDPIKKKSLKLMYLTNRPITYVDATRNLLNELQDDDNVALPKGPLIGFTGNLAGVFKMDFYHVNAHEFKYDTIQKYVVQPFVSVGGDMDEILYAGFGNTLYDMHAYHRAGIDANRMFIIDKKSRIYCCDASSSTGSDDHSNNTGNSTNQVKKKSRQILNHPKQYESMKGTLFAAGYVDPKLMNYISRLNHR